MMKQVYQACDGQVFSDLEEAAQHEREVLASWLKNTQCGQFCADVLSIMDNTTEDEWYGTERDLGMEFVSAAFFRKVQEVPVAPYDAGDNEFCIRSEN